jgi:hypothetical protein
VRTPGVFRESARILRDVSDQSIGGELTIPDGWYVTEVDLDALVPTCIICKDGGDFDNRKRLEIPLSLAYYLSTHYNGSARFRKAIETNARNDLRTKLRALLDFEQPEA